MGLFLINHALDIHELQCPGMEILLSGKKMGLHPNDHRESIAGITRY
jgi:hypothetical protein